VSQSQNTFVVECFIDELAHLARIEPLRYRLGLLGSHPRLAAVLRLAAERAGWGSPLPPGRGRGVAICTYGSTCVAQIAEVALIEDRLRVERVTCAIDCGIVINPLGVEAQIEGGIGWGLSAALAQRITFRDGRAEQSGFSDFPVLRMADMPRVDVHIARSQEEPGGVGEPGVSPIAPAVANALFAAAGQRVRRLPLSEALPLASRRTGQ
jgi:isoquinoline 1-oxidoreductase beta subunit